MTCQKLKQLEAEKYRLQTGGASEEEIQKVTTAIADHENFWHPVGECL